MHAICKQPQPKSYCRFNESCCTSVCMPVKNLTIWPTLPWWQCSQCPFEHSASTSGSIRRVRLWPLTSRRESVFFLKVRAKSKIGAIHRQSNTRRLDIAVLCRRRFWKLHVFFWVVCLSSHGDQRSLWSLPKFLTLFYTFNPLIYCLRLYIIRQGLRLMWRGKEQRRMSSILQINDSSLPQFGG